MKMVEEDMVEVKFQRISKTINDANFMNSKKVRNTIEPTIISPEFYNAYFLREIRDELRELNKMLKELKEEFIHD